jgi:hypothetical protein
MAGSFFALDFFGKITYNVIGYSGTKGVPRLLKSGKAPGFAFPQ